MKGSVPHICIVQVIVTFGENSTYLEFMEKVPVRRTTKESNFTGPSLSLRSFERTFCSDVSGRNYYASEALLSVYPIWITWLHRSLSPIAHNNV